jgi:hypothetical protein
MSERVLGGVVMSGSSVQRVVSGNVVRRVSGRVRGPESSLIRGMWCSGVRGSSSGAGRPVRVGGSGGAPTRDGCCTPSVP